MAGHGTASSRALRTGWHRAENGEWRYQGAVDNLWELICPACGDDGGPPEEQTEAVQKLRGPYPKVLTDHSVYGPRPRS